MDKHEIELSQGPIQFRETGEGPTLLFVHGLLVNGKLWDKVIHRLGPGFRCIAPDLPLGSHLLPMHTDANLTIGGIATLVGELMDALDLTDVILVGNDTGGAVCQIVAGRNHPRLGRLVLTNCDLFQIFLPRMFRYLQWGAHVPGFLRLLSSLGSVSAVRRLPFAYGWLAKNIDDDLLEAFAAPATSSAFVRRDLGKVLRSISPVWTEEAAKQLPGFRKPVLIAWAHDRFFPMEEAERLRALLPNAQMAVVENAWTFSPLDNPDRLSELLQSFVRQDTTAQGES